MFGIGIQEFGLILVVALLVFGPKRLPELARMLGRGMGEFRRASNDLRQSLALDDLQNDLRRDFQSAQSMLKPDAKSQPSADRPAQAGDEIPTPDGSEPSAPAVTEKHPGELPLGNDHEHHDSMPPEPHPESSRESSTESRTDSGAKASAANETTAESKRG